MQFIKLSDVEEAVESSYGILDLMDRLKQLKIYNAEYKSRMPIRIRDYGYTICGKPGEYACGADQSHHWLQIEDDGRLRFTNMQCGAVTVSEESAKVDGECCFIPTFEHEDEFGSPVRYITPERLLVIREE
ncbi:MAG: hypothetical protein LUC83_00790 [Clostridiales bacterium]|nr:hypothetical protein [Clostridiales bacterium]